jgi:CheY-like chemotaxis protein
VKNILVVDDDPSMRFMLRLILEGIGYEVSEAHHGAAALIRLEESLPDLLVTDMMMPVMDGGELIRQLRADPRTAGLLILVMSGNPDAEEIGRDADAVMGKPFSPNDLETRVSLLLGAGKVDAGT